MEDKLVMAVAGYVELYDFTNHSYNGLNRKQQAWSEFTSQQNNGWAKDR